MGSRLGPYEILSQIGAGGMGEVYCARDTKLGRDVAIKVLPEAFARGAARMARFTREAKLLAALDHPNIASIFGLEDSGPRRPGVRKFMCGRFRRTPRRAIPLQEASGSYRTGVERKPDGEEMEGNCTTSLRMAR